MQFYKHFLRNLWGFVMNIICFSFTSVKALAFCDVSVILAKWGSLRLISDSYDIETKWIWKKEGGFKYLDRKYDLKGLKSFLNKQSIWQICMYLCQHTTKIQQNVRFVLRHFFLVWKLGFFLTFKWIIQYT
jgi:hypothetical protein